MHHFTSRPPPDPSPPKVVACSQQVGDRRRRHSHRLHHLVATYEEGGTWRPVEWFTNAIDATHIHTQIHLACGCSLRLGGNLKEDLDRDEILKDGFCLNMIDTPLCPLKVVTNLQEAVWDADIVVNGLPSTETSEVFEEISRYWKERLTSPIIISLAKGIEAELEPVPPGVPMENILYLGGPNIASEIYNKEYANARICGSEKWRKPLAKFLRQPHFIVWDNSDLVTHEVMGGLKNVYAIGAGMVAALTNESATSKSVYFAHCTSEMIFITHLLTEEPEKLAGPLLADTYVTLLKGRNAWYGQMLAKGELRPDMGDSIKGKGMIQGVSAVHAFYELLGQSCLKVLHPDENRGVAPVELCPILKTLYRILIKRELSTEGILQALRDETMNDPRDRIEIAQGHGFYKPSLLGQQLTNGI
ncbi:putative glycerol-3-phosphate dehydrogenase NAD(+) 1 [Nymphaea thermarum]|nr:putative glycerol-3-phosphate dehydrogenase NAD(+) 1 [Nymphaea thermarum]